MSDITVTHLCSFVLLVRLIIHQKIIVYLIKCEAFTLKYIVGLFRKQVGLNYFVKVEITKQFNLVTL